MPLIIEQIPLSRAATTKCRAFVRYFVYVKQEHMLSLKDRAIAPVPQYSLPAI